MDKFAAIKAFVCAVEKGSFAAAARELGFSRSQINRLVVGLEDELGVQLLHRTTRSVSLTPSGDTYYQRCRIILGDMQEAEDTIQAEHTEARGEIRLNAPLSFGIRHLAPALVEFMQRHPLISVHLLLGDQFLDPSSEGIDVTLRIAERREQPSLIEHEIAEAHRVICAAPSFLRTHGTPQHPSDLAQLTCLHYGNLPTGGIWRLQNGKEIVDVRVKGRLCSNNADVLSEAAINGLGIVMLPVFIAGAAIKARRLKVILKDFRPPPIFLSLVYLPDRHHSTRNRLLVKFLQEWFEQHPVL
jgi:DNA-binding transcriptional LysR family regulator